MAEITLSQLLGMRLFVENNITANVDSLALDKLAQSIQTIIPAQAIDATPYIASVKADKNAQSFSIQQMTDVCGFVVSAQALSVQAKPADIAIAEVR